MLPVHGQHQLAVVPPFDVRLQIADHSSVAEVYGKVECDLLHNSNMQVRQVTVLPPDSS